MGYLTVTQITDKLDSILAAQDVIISGGKSYKLSDGQGEISVTRDSLDVLQKMFDWWEARYEEETGVGYGDIVSVEVRR